MLNAAEDSQNGIEIHTDLTTGVRETKRPAWLACWEALQPGDLLIVTSMDRLGRDLVEVVRTVRDVLNKEADLKVLSPAVDTRTPADRETIAFLASAAQWDQELSVERTRFGLRNAHDRRITGRPPRVSDEQIRDAMAEIEAGESVTEVTARLRLTRQAFYRRARGLQNG